MKVSELRIGNYVSIRDDIRKVNSVYGYPRGERISTTIKGCTFAECHFSEDAVKPVPINEEWLLRFGFEKSGRIFKKQDNWFEIEKHQAYWFSTFGEDVKLKYIHQLQNLYHSLTGEELTIK